MGTNKCLASANKAQSARKHTKHKLKTQSNLSQTALRSASKGENMNKLTRKCVAAIASLAMAGTLCVAGAVTMASVAWAAKPGIPQSGGGKKSSNPSKAPWEQDAPTKGTITIIKCDAAKGDYAPGTDGAESKCPAGNKPLSGAVFKVTKVTKIGNDDVDLTKLASWKNIANIITKLNEHTVKESGNTAEITLDTNSTTLTATDASGKTTSSDLALGLYKVEEITPPTGYGVSDLQYFYMTLPMISSSTDTQTNKTTTTYDYNPVVKPKNKNLSKTITKTVDGSKTFTGVSDKVPFTITTELNVPKPDGRDLTEDDLKGFAVFDDAPTAAFANIAASAVTEVKVDDTKLTDGTNSTTKEYEVTAEANSTGNKITTAGDKMNLEDKRTRVLVKFTEDGRKKLLTALKDATKANHQVTVSLEFSLSDAYKKSPTGDAADNKELVNKSGYFQAVGNDNTDLPPIIPEGDDAKSASKVDFGYLQVHKYKAEHKDVNLKDAEFKIFSDQKKAQGCADGLFKGEEISKIEACKAASAFEGKTDGTTTGAGNKEESTGKFKVPYKAVAGSKLYVVEIKAPAGYKLSNVIKDVTVEKTSTVTNPTVAEFPNIPEHNNDGKSFWFNLPATGAAGVILFALAGMGLIAASVFLYMRNRKEEEQQAKA
ncbi:LPXTG-motif protein cell wall anchor domain protein [Gardnerella vaginalis JCP8522]|nr:LPXTG-motif protein cell wall anchor domain protein [Gardnerella vaginalis JCP8522]